MSTDSERSKLSVDELAGRCRSELRPLTSKFSYFSILPIAEEDLRQYLNDPIAAISPAIVAQIPNVGVILAPYLERNNGKEADLVSFDRPPEHRQLRCVRRDEKSL